MKLIKREKERNHQIYLLRQQGLYLKQIADRYGISVTRVRQILEREEQYEQETIRKEV